VLLWHLNNESNGRNPIAGFLPLLCKEKTYEMGEKDEIYL